MLVWKLLLCAVPPHVLPNCLYYVCVCVRDAEQLACGGHWIRLGAWRLGEVVLHHVQHHLQLDHDECCGERLCDAIISVVRNMHPGITD